MKRSVLIPVALAAAIGALFAGCWIRDFFDPRHGVARILNIPKPPRSLRVIGSESTGFTDVMETISIQIDPREFPLLLKGYPFEETRVKGTSHSLTTSDHEFEANVGPLFDVTTQYEVFYSPFGGRSNPEEFEDGGFVRIYTDETRHHAVIDLYIE